MPARIPFTEHDSLIIAASKIKSADIVRLSDNIHRIVLAVSRFDTSNVLVRFGGTGEELVFPSGKHVEVLLDPELGIPFSDVEL